MEKAVSLFKIALHIQLFDNLQFTMVTRPGGCTPETLNGW